ncbi:MAG TPA: GGDEF domain-containing protein [Candidatus Woesebacteria bacterium]|nr:GGDEF domain-containing protein [Candidatus Woesebacteria bacterium]
MSERISLNPLALERIQAEFKNAQDSVDGTIPVIEAADKISELIFNDTLTNFENWRGLKRYRDNLISEQFPLTILTFDLDNLKKINDNPDPDIGGHANGNKYILSFVKFVNGIFPDTKKFRFGGDEFIVPVANIDPKELTTIYQKLEVFNKKEQNPNKLEFTYAFHIAHSKEDFYDALERSDNKLVKAKKSKKSQISLSNS